MPDWFSDENEAAGVAVADVDGDGRLDLVVFMLDAPAGPNQGWFRVGWALDPATGTVTGGWTGWQQVPDWFPSTNAGGDITVADIDGDGRPDLVVLMVDAPPETNPNAGYYRSGPLEADGTVTHWRPWQALPDWPFWENQGAAVAVADLDGDGHAELVVLAVDNPPQKNEAFWTVGWRLDGRGRPGDGWGPWTKVPGWDFWENQGCGLAVTPLGAAGEPHLVVLAVDNPIGQNAAFQRVLDAMTDREMAPEMGVWRLLEDGSGTLAVHAALLNTGDVLFFAGSSNDPDRHNAHQFGTTVWRYPGAEQQQPDTPSTCSACGHAFLPDGRLLAAGGTQQYDPFLGLRQSIAFDPVDPDLGAAAGDGGRALVPVVARAGRRARARDLGARRDQPAQPRPGGLHRRRRGGRACRRRRTGRCTGTCSCWPTAGSSTAAASTGRTTVSGPRSGTSARTPPSTSPACPTPAAATSRPASCCRPRRTSG